jgi:hypothetical protein
MKDEKEFTTEGMEDAETDVKRPKGTALWTLAVVITVICLE